MKKEEFTKERPLGFRHVLSMKSLALVVATLVSLLGSLGQFFLVDGWNDVANARAGEMRGIESRIATLRSTQTEYFNAQVQGNLLFALDPADQTRNRGLVAKLYQLSLYDRAFPFRALLGELAIAGVIDYAATHAQYQGLQDAARTEFTFQNFTAVNEFERKIIDDALALQHRLQDRYFQAEAEKAEAEAIRDRRRLWLIGLSALGTCLLLVANLLTAKA